MEARERQGFTSSSALLNWLTRDCFSHALCEFPFFGHCGDSDWLPAAGGKAYLFVLCLSGAQHRMALIHARSPLALPWHNLWLVNSRPLLLHCWLGSYLLSPVFSFSLRWAPLPGQLCESRRLGGRTVLASELHLKDPLSPGKEAVLLIEQICLL